MQVVPELQLAPEALTSVQETPQAPQLEVEVVRLSQPLLSGAIVTQSRRPALQLL